MFKFLKKLDKLGFGYVDTIVGVAILGIIAIGAIKVVEVKYSKKNKLKTSNDIYSYISKVRRVLSNKTSCRKTFAKKNLVRKRHSIKIIKNGKGNAVNLIGDKIMAKYILQKIETKNHNLDYDDNGIFTAKFTFSNLSKNLDNDDPKVITTHISLFGNVDAKGHILSCYVDDDGFIVKALKSACRKLEN